MDVGRYLSFDRPGIALIASGHAYLVIWSDRHDEYAILVDGMEVVLDLHRFVFWGARFVTGATS